MTTPEIIQQLVKRFEEHKETYRSGRYNETQLRREFLDPFFEALGWDVFNKQGYAEMYKDVVHEDSLEIEGENKAPDYAFRIGGQRKFFVEAKKPAVKIETDIHPAFQLRRYAWSAKLPLSILSDFEELAVYDCRAKPDKKDKASVGRVKLYSYKEYVEKWDEIAGIFAREAVLKGSFDAFAEGTRLKKGTAEVDDAFLAEIERWRDLLATNIATNNQALSVRELNYAVQMTIDRLVFLRICEDRGVERDEQLKEIAFPLRPADTSRKLAGNGKAQGEDHADLGEAGKGGVYEALCQLFKRADARYNSGLFHFSEEKDASSPTDSLTLTLKIDDKPLKDIIKNLYYPESPYVFREIPADILGQVYERFLGKVIRLTAGHRAKVEEKPEVRKAGGVYYTPTYIVEYIVENTVGKLVAGKTPKEVEKLRVLDPACGSGTFPLGAYQYLLDWHLKWYLDNEPQKWATGKKPVIFESKDGYRLTTSKKKDILLNNIYGVDIDPQAVEVTKLSLLLKVLEGESHETIGSQLALFQERVLPDLGRNIKCGNSLIGPDYYEGRQLTMLVDEEERYRVNAFDWKAEFSQVFIQGGFDAVIGNPPYIRIQTLQESSPIDVEFFKKRYEAASKGNYDIYVVFVEKGLDVLNKNGRLGFILPHKFFNAQYGEPIRGVIANGKHLAKVVHFGDQQVFESATTYTCLLFLDKTAKEEFEFTKVESLADWRALQVQTSEVSETSEVSGMIDAKQVTESEWNFSTGAKAVLFEKINKVPLRLGEISHLFVGLQTDADDVYILEEVRREGEKVLCFSKSTNKEHWFENSHLKPFLKGSLNIRRYYLSNVTKRLIFPYLNENGKSVLIEPEIYQSNFPLTWAYLEECKKRLSARNKGNMGKDWYGYVYKKNHTRFNNPKLLVPSLGTGSCFAADIEGEYYFVGSGGGGGGGYGISLLPETKLNYYYLLGLLNSSLLSEYLKSISTPFQGGYIALNRQYIEQLPIRPINFDDPADKARHDKLVSLVERMLALHKSPTLPSPKSGGFGGGGAEGVGGGRGRTPQEQEMLKREIESTDRAIDRLVYELYGLSEEEIGIVEGS